MNYWTQEPRLTPPEPRDHWYDCPANPHNGGEEDECECDEIDYDKYAEAQQRRYTQRMEDEIEREARYGL